MVCDNILLYLCNFCEKVLILILLEYGLRQLQKELEKCGLPVLILILLEYGLRRLRLGAYVMDEEVLILILLEYGLRQFVECSNTYGLNCLNPYSIGIWSATPAHRGR